MTADSALECIEFNREWKKLNERYDDAALSSEEKSAVIMLKNFETLKLCGGILRVDGKICGCTVGEPTYPGSDTFVVHTEKALYDTVGAYPMLFSRFLKSLGGKYKYVNREDDVGDEGLRKSKLSYNPVFLEEKYSGFTVSPEHVMNQDILNEQSKNAQAVLDKYRESAQKWVAEQSGYLSE